MNRLYCWLLSWVNILILSVIPELTGTCRHLVLLLSFTMAGAEKLWTKWYESQICWTPAKALNWTVFCSVALNVVLCPLGRKHFLTLEDVKEIPFPSRTFSLFMEGKMNLSLLPCEFPPSLPKLLRVDLQSRLVLPRFYVHALSH